MNKFQQLVHSLEAEHRRQLQHKDLLIRDLVDKLEVVTKENTALAVELDVLKTAAAADAEREEMRKPKARRTSSPSRVFVEQTPTGSAAARNRRKSLFEIPSSASMSGMDSPESKTDQRSNVTVKMEKPTLPVSATARDRGKSLFEIPSSPSMSGMDSPESKADQRSNVAVKMEKPKQRISPHARFSRLKPTAERPHKAFSSLKTAPKPHRSRRTEKGMSRRTEGVYQRRQASIISAVTANQEEPVPVSNQDAVASSDGRPSTAPSTREEDPTTTRDDAPAVSAEAGKRRERVYKADPVRGNARKQLHAHDCECCSGFYAATRDIPALPACMGGRGEQDRKQTSSRHRGDPGPDSPPGFWDTEFPDTQEVREMKEEGRKRDERKRLFGGGGRA
ncbi:MAG: hypothetical protein SGCHY_005282 [Lobulomycetales sp.]